MRFPTPLALLIAAGLVLVGCGDDDAETSAGDTTSSSTTAAAETSEPVDDTTTTTTPAPIVRVEVPSELAAAEQPTDALTWFAVLHEVTADEGTGHLGTGVSPEPAEVIDPNASITANQALAAAHGTAQDLYDGPLGDPEQLVSEEIALDGRPAWHVRVRFAADVGQIDVDLVGFEDSGDFNYAVAVTQGLDDASVATLHQAVAAATTS